MSWATRCARLIPIWRQSSSATSAWSCKEYTKFCENEFKLSLLLVVNFSKHAKSYTLLLMPVFFTFVMFLIIRKIVSVSK
jgi:hypothetical protein